MLVRDIATVKEHFPNTTVTDVKILNPYLLAATEKYLTPYLGMPTYQRLDEYLTASRTPEDSSLNGLLPFTQRVTVYFAYRDSVPMRNLMETNTGYGVVQNANLAPASKERTEQLKSGIEELGWNSIDQMLAYLEENQTEFPEWYASPISTLAHRNLVNNATEFGQYVYMNNFSRVSFQSIRPVMDNVENLTIANAIGSDTLAEIKFKIFSNTVPTNEKNIVDDLKRALANLTMNADVPAPDRNAFSPYAIFNIATEARRNYWLTGMEYLNRAKAALSPLPDPAITVTNPNWENHPDNKIYVFGG